MDTILLTHWKTLFKSLLPKLAHVRNSQQEEQVIIAADWYLRADKDRPNKRSRLLKIIFTPEAISIYLKKTTAQKAQCDELLLTHLQNKLKQFNPDHTASMFEVPPSEEWVIDSAVLHAQVEAGKK